MFFSALFLDTVVNAISGIFLAPQAIFSPFSWEQPPPPSHTHENEPLTGMFVLPSWPYLIGPEVDNRPNMSQSDSHSPKLGTGTQSLVELFGWNCDLRENLILTLG